MATLFTILNTLFVFFIIIPLKMIVRVLERVDNHRATKQLEALASDAQVQMDDAVMATQNNEMLRSRLIQTKLNVRKTWLNTRIAARKNTFRFIRWLLNLFQGGSLISGILFAIVIGTGLSAALTMATLVPTWAGGMFGGGDGSSFVADGSDSKGGDSDNDIDLSLGENGSLEGQQFVKPIYNYLHGKYGLSAEAVAGALGNWRKESGVSPLAVQGRGFQPKESIRKAAAHGDSGVGLGLVQWSSERHDALVSYAESKGKPWWDLQTQLDFFVQKDSPTTLKDYANNATNDVVHNTIIFHDTIEISSDSRATVRDERGGYAKQYYAYMKKKGMTGKMDKNKVAKIGS